MKKRKMTPREKQLRFREAATETIGWLVLALVPYAMFLHWVLVGY